MQIRELNKEEVQRFLETKKYKTEFTKRLSTLEVGCGIEVEGEIRKIRMKAQNFQKRSGYVLSVLSGENGWAKIIRQEGTWVSSRPNPYAEQVEQLKAKHAAEAAAGQHGNPFGQ